MKRDPRDHPSSSASRREVADDSKDKPSSVTFPGNTAGTSSINHVRFRDERLEEGKKKTTHGVHTVRALHEGTEKWTRMSSLWVGRACHTAALLSQGNVLQEGMRISQQSLLTRPTYDITDASEF